MEIHLDIGELRKKAEQEKIDLAEYEKERQRRYASLNDLEALIGLLERLYVVPSSPSALEPASTGPSIATDTEQDLAGMDTKSAFLHLLRTSGRAWPLREATVEMLRRGWKQRYPTDDAFSAVNTAAGRVARANPNIVKPQYGWYAWKPADTANNGQLAVSVEGVDR
jgi:hypothetical protein